MEEYQNTYNEIDEYANGLIRSKARSVIGRAGFTFDDCDDIEQELALDLLKRLKHYDRTKAKKSTFMARIVDNCIATMLEKRYAACRDWRLCQESLDAPVWDEGDEEPRGARLLDPKAVTSDDIALKLDIQAVLETLPVDLHDLWDRLLLDPNLSHIAQETGIPRTTLHDKRKRLCKALCDSGLSEYFTRPRQFPDPSGK